MDTEKIGLTLKISWITLVTAIVAILGVEFAAGAMAGAGRCSPLAAVLFARLAEAALMLAGVVFWQRSVGVVGLGRSDIARGIKAGLAWSLVFGGLAAAAGAVILSAGIDPTRFFGSSPSAGSPPLYFLTGAVISPFVEELFFRGILYGFFRRWGVAAGLILTTAIFAGMHLPGNSVPIPQVIGGIVFCLAYEKEKSLMAPYIIHALGNAAIFSLGMLQ